MWEAEYNEHGRLSKDVENDWTAPYVPDQNDGWNQRRRENPTLLKITSTKWKIDSTWEIRQQNSLLRMLIGSDLHFKNRLAKVTSAETWALVEFLYKMRNLHQHEDGIEQHVAEATLLACIELLAHTSQTED